MRSNLLMKIFLKLPLFIFIYLKYVKRNYWGQITKRKINICSVGKYNWRACFIYQMTELELPTDKVIRDREAQFPKGMH